MSAPASSDEAPPVESTAPTAQLGGDVGSMASLLHEVAATGAGAPLAAGTVIDGQYRIEKAVGAGGMGVVYLARDLRLERAVAIKLGAARSSSALARIQGEAAALAQLSHPNVVVVHQVGQHAGRIYLAMEYVGGGTARSWVSERPRTWREIVALYAAAGDGLAAAHSTGLVHRDVKPDNLVVGDDGRPRVADFGLARAIAATDDDGEGAISGEVASTRTGAVVGTLGYMPPEQLAGEAVDARADQFAFAVALWEALHGRRPFAGATVAELRAAIAATPPAVGEGRRVPRHVTEALRRALAPRRDDRWPAMAPLLAALRHDPRVRRQRVALALGGAALAAAIAVPLTLRARSTPDPCTDAEAALAPTWSAARAARLATAVGARAWPGIERRVASYSRAWLIGHRDACRATRVARSQSDDLLDRRMACLDRARVTLGATLDAIERGGPAAGLRAPAALDGLPGLDVCADVAGLAAAEPMPTDPALRAKVAEATRLVAAAQAATVEDMKPGDDALATQALAAARSGGWKPQIAEALASQANVMFDSGRAAEAVPLYAEATELALAGGSDRVALRNLLDAAWSLGALAKSDEAARMLALGRALWERLGRPPAETRKVLSTTAFVAQAAGRHADAIAAMRELVAAVDSGRAIGSPARDHYNLASALIGAGQIDEGRPILQEAIALAEAEDGPDHANVARYLALRAFIEQQQGQAAAAIATGQRARAIYEAWFGPADYRLPYVLGTIAAAEVSLGHLDRARAALEQAVLASAAPGHEDDAALAHTQLAALAMDQGDLDRAGSAAARAIALWDGLEDPVAVVGPLVIAGRVAAARGDAAAARAALTRALTLATADPAARPGVDEIRRALAQVRGPR
ncbi:MAG: serine/threonine protein kinase [Myxococcales bacterium]|nr:serine/threonine protein kinase [Myxococcales bacterium]